MSVRRNTGFYRSYDCITLRWFLSLALATPVMAQTRPASTSLPASKVTCALITDSSLRNEPISALVEQNLSQRSDLRTVERMEIDKVLAEQELKLLLGGARSERIRIGQLMKADLLAVLRRPSAGDKNAGDYSLVICETHRGMRLVGVSIQAEGGATRVSARIVAWFEQALAKFASPVQQTVTVSPFSGQDFLHKYDYLQQALAERTQQLLLAQPDTLVVELSEALAIGRELRLAGGEHLCRDLPFFISGEYVATEGTAGDRFSLKLHVRQAERELGAKELSNLTQQELLTETARAAEEILHAASCVRIQKLDPETEARQLQQRAEVFEKAFDHETALSLIDAAVLIRPDDTGLRAKGAALSVALLGKVAERALSQTNRESAKAELRQQGRITLDYYRALDHALERWLLATDLRNVKDTQILESSSWYNQLWGFERRADASPLLEEFKKELEWFDERLLEILEQKVKTGQITAENQEGFYVTLRVSRSYISDEERRWRYLRLIQDVPGTEQAILGLLTSSFTYFPGHLNKPPDYAFTHDTDEELREWETNRRLAEAAKLPGRSVQKALAILREVSSWPTTLPKRPESPKNGRKDTLHDEWAEVRFRQGDEILSELVNHGEVPKGFTQTIAAPAAEIPIAYEELEFKHSTSGQSGGDAISTLTGWLGCPDFDVVWTPEQVFIMRQKGILESIHRFDGPCLEELDRQSGDLYNSPRRASVAFDGHFLWIPARFAAKPHLVVVDTKTGKSRTLTESDGLPSMQYGLCVSGISPGKACVAAAFGRSEAGAMQFDRSWCAIVECSAQGPARVTMLLKNERVPGAAEKHQDPIKGVFLSCALYTLTNPADPLQQAVLLFRSNTSALRINPTTREIKECRVQWSPSYFIATEAGRICVLHFTSMCIVGFPDFNEDSGPLPVRSQTKDHYFEDPVSGGDMLYRGTDPWAIGLKDHVLHTIAFNAWWVAPCCRTDVQPLRGKLPQGYRVFLDIVSSHVYGLVLLAGYDRWPVRALQVTVDETILRGLQQQSLQLGEQEVRDRAKEAKALEVNLARFANERVRPPWWMYLPDWAIVMIAAVFSMTLLSSVVMLRNRRRAKTAAQLNSGQG